MKKSCLASDDQKLISSHQVNGVSKVITVTKTRASISIRLVGSARVLLSSFTRSSLPALSILKRSTPKAAQKRKANTPINFMPLKNARTYKTRISPAVQRAMASPRICLYLIEIRALPKKSAMNVIKNVIIMIYYTKPFI